MSKRAAVTGSTGMLGSHLVVELLRRGYSHIALPVRSASRLPALAATLRREGFQDLADSLSKGEISNTGPLHPIVTQLNDPAGLREAFAGSETVFHCAATVSLTDADPKDLIHSNVEITSHVVDAAIDCGVRRLVHTSSVAALGEASEGHKYIDEKTEIQNLAASSPYGVSKFLSENRAWRGAMEGLEVVVVNPGVILGEGDWKSGGSTLIIPLAAGGIPFYTDGAMGYIDVRDVARAEAELAECKEAAGERFILVAENLTYRDFFSRVALLAGKRRPQVHVGRTLLGMAWRGDRLLSILTGRTPKLTRAVAESAAGQLYYDGSKIKRYLPGFLYTPIGQTLQRVVKAYLNEGQR